MIKHLNMSDESAIVVPITVTYGDGIGPEIMQVTLDVLRHAGARISINVVEVGEALYRRGYTSGISDEAWRIIRNNRVFLKAPITTPQGGGYKSLNVTIRKALGLYANIRPCIAYHPIVKTHFPEIDVTIIRENDEDLYAGIEYRQTRNMRHAIKMVSHRGCERIMRYAFEYARKNNRKKVTCFTKDNIMKLTDGLFHSIFDAISSEYSDIKSEHYILDIGAARLATDPGAFDVVVTLNLYGDVISDIVAEMTGSVGLAGSANIGEQYAMFEAIHGSAPSMIGTKRANPSAILNAAVMMLIHIGQGTVASLIRNSLLYTIESGVHTPDIAKGEHYTKKIVNTDEFGEEIVKNLGRVPSILKPSLQYADFDFDGLVPVSSLDQRAVWSSVSNEHRELVGVDVFLGHDGNAQDIGDLLKDLKYKSLSFNMLAASGLKVYPWYNAGAVSGDHWCARFIVSDDCAIEYSDVIALLNIITSIHLEIIKTENLYLFDKKPSFSIIQGA